MLNPPTSGRGSGGEGIGPSRLANKPEPSVSLAHSRLGPYGGVSTYRD